MPSIKHSEMPNRLRWKRWQLPKTCNFRVRRYWMNISLDNLLTYSQSILIEEWNTDWHFIVMTSCIKMATKMHLRPLALLTQGWVMQLKSRLPFIYADPSGQTHVWWKCPTQALSSNQTNLTTTLSPRPGSGGGNRTMPKGRARVPSPDLGRFFF